jgi:thiamine transport system substrate-binding protein
MRKGIAALLLFGLLLAACGGQSGSTATSPPAAPTAAPAPTAEAAPAPTGVPVAGGATLVIMSHDSFNVSEAVIKAFEQETGARIQLLKSGDAGSALNKAILSKDNPLADLFFGVDNTFLSRALKADIFEPYPAPALKDIPDQFKLDPSNSLLPIDYGYIAINYDKDYLAKNNLQPPAALEDLTKPEWKDKLVVENPATSSPGLAFMLATIGHFGTEGSYTWLNYWQDLKQNNVLVTEGWDEAYYIQFSGSSGKGPRPLVVSYATSPPAEVFFSEGKLSEPPTGNVMAGNFLQVEFAGIFKNTKQRALAERFIDFMLSKQFQEDIPLQMFVYPVLPSAALPEIFTKFAQVPEQPVSVAPEQIEQNREQWIDAWTKAVLR